MSAAVFLSAGISRERPPDEIPRQPDWVDYGLVVDTGPMGEAWDAIMEGATPCAVVKAKGSYLLYYVGADDYIAQKNNIGPSHRSIGVAVSPDGVRWTKHDGNPVLTFSSSGNPEEGAVSCGMFLDASGEIVSYYGANVAQNPTTPSVNADVRLATSVDGLSFASGGLVLDHSDGSIWGAGDELHAVAGFRTRSKWFGFYIPNGVAQESQVGFAWGFSRESLTSSGPVVSGGNPVPARGPVSIVRLRSGKLAVFSNFGGTMTARTALASAPTIWSAPVATYALPGSGIVFLDRSKRTWFLYYNRWSWMGMKIAPMGSPDATPPTAVGHLGGAAIAHREVRLSWGAAEDPETGIVAYRIYRDGVLLGSARDRSYRDLGVSERTSYSYAVTAVNLHGAEGPESFVEVTTPADVTAPGIHAIRAGGDPNQVSVTFDEPVAASTAEAAGSYAVSGGVQVQSASLAADERTVVLTTSPQAPNGRYTLSVNGVQDRAAAPNSANVQAEYTYGGSPGLVAYWRLDETEGTIAEDTSGRRHAGQIRGNPLSVTGILSGAGSFDGAEDYVEVDDTPSLDGAAYGSFSIAAWAHPSNAPPNTTNSNWAYTIASGPSFALRYESDQRFVASIRTSDGEFRLASPSYAPGSWHHVAMVKDEAARILRLYVDGGPAAAPRSFTGDVGNPPVSPRTNHDEYWGRYRLAVEDPLFDYWKNFFRGTLDDVRIYDRALDADELARLYELPMSQN